MRSVAAASIPLSFGVEYWLVMNCTCTVSTSLWLHASWMAGMAMCSAARNWVKRVKKAEGLQLRGFSREWNQPTARPLE